MNTLTGTFVVTIVLFALRPHRFSLPRQLKSLIPSMKSGAQLLISRICWYGYSNLDQTIIGKYLGKTDLGAYSFSMTFARVPLDEVVSLVGKVVPGIFSTVQHDIEKLKRYFLMLTEAIAYISFPLAFGLMITTDDFIRLALGAQWDAVIAPLRILCIYTIIYASQTLMGHVFLWTGHFKLNMYLTFISLFLLPVGFYIGTFWGLTGVAWSWVIVFPITLIPTLYFLCKILKMPIIEWIRTLSPALSGCAFMTVVVLTSRIFLAEDLPHWYRLSVQSVSGGMSYILFMIVFYRKRIQFIWKAVKGNAPDTL